MRNVLTLLLLLTASAAIAADPVEGKWLGTVGDDRDRVAIGLDIKSRPNGDLIALVTQPVVNFYNLPTRVTRDGEKYVIADLGTTLTLRESKLEGTQEPANFLVELSRTDALPTDPPVPDFPKGPDPQWQAQLGGALYAPVTVRDGFAYAGTTSGIFNAVNVADGKFAWTFNAGRPIFGGALVTSDAVYFNADNGFLFKLDRKTGKEVFRYDLGDAMAPRILPHPYVYDWDNKSPQPVIADGIVFTGSGDGSLHAVNASTGKRVWRFATGGKIRTDAAIAGDNVITGSLDHFIYAVNRKTGVQAWKRDTKAEVTGNPALVAGKIVAGTRGSALFALNPADGNRVWTASFWGSWVESAAVQYGEFLYIGSSDLRRVTCYDPKDGRVVWRTDVYGWTWGQPLVTEKVIYAGVAGGGPYFIRHVPSLTALDRSTGKVLWRWVPPASHAFQSGFPAGPALENGMLVIGAMDGTLYGFRLAL